MPFYTISELGRGAEGEGSLADNMAENTHSDPKILRNLGSKLVLGLTGHLRSPNFNGVSSTMSPTQGNGRGGADNVGDRNTDSG